MEDSYLAPAQASESEFSEKKSAFLGHLRPVECEDEAKAFVEEMKKKYSDARHNVWAYHLPDGTKRLSDDGEPSGTGGAPVLDAMVKRGVCGCAIVVTRYFGGILLGTGGLSRAYGKAAGEALELAGTVRIVTYEKRSVRCSYARFGTVSRLCEKYKCRDLKTSFEENAELVFLIDPASVPSFEEELREKSLGELSSVLLGKAQVRF